MKNSKLDKASKIALENFLGLKPSEKLLILSDWNKREIGLSLYDQGRKIAKETVYLEIKPQDINGEEPSPEIAELFKNYDLVVAATSKSFTHTDARRNACASGVRFATMPGITVDMMARCLSADVNKIIATTAQVEKALSGAKELRVTTALGTDITLPIKGRKILPSTGVLNGKGAGGNLPSGEVYCAPLEGKSNGTIIFDGSIAGIGILNKPILVNIKDGYAREFIGGKQAKQFEKMLAEVGEDALQIAELGIGTNYKAKITGIILEDEKVLGTVHIAFGNNKSMGGIIDVPIHLDGLIKKPNVFVDGVQIMKNGKLLI